jgi:hypothetical protein
MNTSIFTRYQAYVYLTLSLVLCILTGCKGLAPTFSVSTVTDEPGLSLPSGIPKKVYWVVGPTGIISTNDFKKLVPLMPFEPVLPQYLPDELKVLPPALVLDKNSMVQIVDNSTLVNEKITEFRLQYQTITTSMQGLFIIETNSAYPWPKINEGFSMIKINDTEVYEHISEHKFEYLWYRNKISFSSIVYRYDQSEARRMIESMLQ